MWLIDSHNQPDRRAPARVGGVRWVWLFWSDRCRGRHDRVEACACESAPGLGVIGALVPCCEGAPGRSTGCEAERSEPGALDVIFSCLRLLCLPGPRPGPS